MNSLGVAVVGLGVGEQHARAFARESGCRLLWLHDLDVPKARRLASELGARAAGYEQILDDPDVAIVSIASYDDAHCDQVIAALQAGKHVLCEKPLCRSARELSRIRTAWQASGPRHLAVNLVLRAAPAYLWLKGALASGELGTPYAYDGDYLYGRIDKITRGWRKEVAGYSVIQGGGVHLVDLMLWLTGSRPIEVSAAGNRICTVGTEFRYLDFVTATYRFADGLVGRITANFGCVHRHQHVVRMFGTRGTFLHDDQGPRCHESREPAIEPRRLDLSALPASKGALIPGFVRAIASGRDPLDQAAHEFAVVSACLAADRALETGMTTGVEPQ